MIGSCAPHFSCQALKQSKEIRVSLDNCLGHYTVIFFYPLNFTFVCPTELHAFEQERAALEAKNVQIFGVSVDSIHSHRTWLSTPKEQGGIKGIGYALLSDLSKTMSRAFGILDEESSVARRALFILDKHATIQHVTINTNGIGRNVKEVVRIIDALKHHEAHGDVCPANWTSGEPSLKPTSEGVLAYFNS